MSELFLADLQGFHSFLTERLNAPGPSITLEAILDEWRELHPAPEAAEDDLEAIRGALATWDAGDPGRPFEEFDAEFRRKHQIVTQFI